MRRNNQHKTLIFIVLQQNKINLLAFINFVSLQICILFAIYLGGLLPGVAATYLGSDGTQIGIYGGSMPFDPKILNPSIGHITVGGQTNDQGQLPVTIEVVNE